VVVPQLDRYCGCKSLQSKQAVILITMSAYTHAASTTYTLHSLHQPRFLMSDLNPQFEDAAAWLSGNPAAGSLSNDIKLEVRRSFHLPIQARFSKVLKGS
jgi:hypothetical protein